ncbi:MAG TPA: hypothetical protein VM582_04130, partial [Candidatus Thermoplasmatota archaeon]|nr:hypothetical protein [Candidatus Thermoplasmatota archaeon]
GVSVRFEPIATGAVRARDVTVALLDENGTQLPATPLVTAIEDGAFDVVITAHAPLPPVVSVLVSVPGAPAALRTLRTLGQAVSFDGAFAPEMQAAWEGGEALDATRQPDSERGDPAAFRGERPPPDERPLPPPAERPVPGPTRGVPAGGLLLAVAAVALAVALRRRP